MTVSPTIPTTIGSYRVIDALGAGGMAQLYVAEPLGGGRRVAIKKIRDHLSDVPRYVEMFMDEARVLKCIDHPNVVSVAALSGCGNDYFMVMEYVDGVTLGALMNAAFTGGAFIEVDVAVRIATKALEGLGAAHGATGLEGRPLDVVHRDVSPTNVLVGRDGRVKVIDFGIAKAHGRLHVTKNGNIKGKLRYMSPEHCGGATVDARSDVYALAIVLWEMLTLRPYFDGDNELEIVRQVRLPTFRSITAWNRDVSVQLEAVLRRALHPDPDQRYQTAHAFRRALLRACPGALAVGPAHLAAHVSALVEGADAPVGTSQHTARHRAAYGYTFHVVVPAGGHDEHVPETKILDDTVRRAAVSRARYHSRRQPAFRGLGWLAAAAMLMFFASGVTGVLMGHALADRSTDSPVAKLIAPQSPSTAERDNPHAQLAKMINR